MGDGVRRPDARTPTPFSPAVRRQQSLRAHLAGPRPEPVYVRTDLEACRADSPYAGCGDPREEPGTTAGTDGKNDGFVKKIIRTACL